MSTRVTRRSINTEPTSWEEEVRKLKFLVASRKTLIKNGFPGTKRCLSFNIKQKIERFKALALSEPAVYGEVGTEIWITGLLTFLNQPTVLSWNDVTDWFKNPNHREFLMAPPATDITSSIRQIPSKQALSPTDGKGRVSTKQSQPSSQKEKTPRLKLGILKLAKVIIVPKPSIGIIPAVDEDEGQESDTAQLSQEVQSPMESDDSAPSCMEEASDLLGLKPAEADNERFAEAQVDREPIIIEGVDVLGATTEGPEAPIPQVVEDFVLASARTPIDRRVRSLQVIPVQFTDCNIPVIDLEADRSSSSPEWIGNHSPIDGRIMEAINNNGASDFGRNIKVALPSSSSTSHNPLPVAGIQAEASPKSNTNNGGIVEVEDNSLVQNMGGNGDTSRRDSEAIAGCSNQSRAHAPAKFSQKYKDTIVSSMEFISNYHARGESMLTTCVHCVEIRERLNTIQHVQYQVDRHAQLVHGSESLKRQCMEIQNSQHQLVMDLWNQQTNNGGACTYLGAN